MSEKKKGNDDEKTWIERWWKLQFPVITLFLIGFFFWTAHRPFDPEFRGYLSPNEYGDSFGMTNAVFSALAFLGVIFTLMLQMIELKAQRDEMILQRKEMIEMQRVQLLSTKLTLMSDGETEFSEGERRQLMRYVNRHVAVYVSENDVASARELISEIVFDFHEVVRLFAELITFNQDFLRTGEDEVSIGIARDQCLAELESVLHLVSSYENYTEIDDRTKTILKELRRFSTILHLRVKNLNCSNQLKFNHNVCNTIQDTVSAARKLDVETFSDKMKEVFETLDG